MQLRLFDVYDHESKAAQEAYAMLTANLHVSNKNNLWKTFALISCNPKEGKTSLATSLSITMAHLGWKVLLIDGAMRKPKAARKLNEAPLLGLSDYLQEKVELNDALCVTNIPKFIYLSCGNDNANPVGLLCSHQFDELVSKVKNDYDIVLFDTPAIASVGDGSIIASKVDATLFVVKMGLTTLTSLKSAKEKLERSNANILGVVLNEVKKRDYKRYFPAYNYFYNSKGFFGYKKGINLPMDVPLKM